MSAREIESMPVCPEREAFVQPMTDMRWPESRTRPERRIVREQPHGAGCSALRAPRVWRSIVEIAVDIEHMNVLRRTSQQSLRGSHDDAAIAAH